MAGPLLFGPLFTAAGVGAVQGPIRARKIKNEGIAAPFKGMKRDFDFDLKVEEFMENFRRQGEAIRRLQAED